MRRKTGGAGAIAVAAACLGTALAGPAAPLVSAHQPATPAVSFGREIQPILSNNCFACHGPDETHRKTKFHFDTKDGAFLEDGVIIPGNAAHSLLYQHITDPD